MRLTTEKVINVKNADNLDEMLVGNTRELGKTIRVIDSRPDIPEDQQNRVMSEADAHLLRVSSGLDLFLVDAESSPPVVKLMDFGKFKYEQKKRAKEIRSKAREVNHGEKTFHFTPAIAEHDYQTKLNHIIEALAGGYRVQIAMRGRGQVWTAMPRGYTFFKAATDPDFVLNRVLVELGDRIQPTKLVPQDRFISANLIAATS